MLHVYLIEVIQKLTEENGDEFVLVMGNESTLMTRQFASVDIRNFFLAMLMQIHWKYIPEDV